MERKMYIICLASADTKLTFKCGLHSNLPADISMFWYYFPTAVYHTPYATGPDHSGTQRFFGPGPRQRHWVCT